MPVAAMRRAEQETLAADLFIVAGSSLVVYPAAGFPELAKENGAALHRLVIHSRVRDAATGDIVSYDTRFVFDDQGSNVAIDE